MEGGRRRKVCVTGGASYIGSWLVKKLLERGHVVHATLRNPKGGDTAKVGLLMSFPGAKERLEIFQADFYGGGDGGSGGFDSAVWDCEFVFHVATPFVHDDRSSKFKDTVEAAVAGVNGILQACKASGSVKRLIFAGSILAASALEDDGSGHKEVMDESCWTPLNDSYPHCEEFEKNYIWSKTLSEKEALRHNDMEGGGCCPEVVSLVLGLVGGDNPSLPYLSASVQNILSPLTGNAEALRQLKFIDATVGCVPLVHNDDVSEAFIFCMERDEAMSGRFLCCSDYPTLPDIVGAYRNNHKDLPVVVGELKEDERKKVRGGSSKLADLGFECKYGLEEILEDTIRGARRVGEL